MQIKLVVPSGGFSPICEDTVSATEIVFGNKYLLVEETGIVASEVVVVCGYPTFDELLSSWRVDVLRKGDFKDDVFFTTDPNDGSAFFLRYSNRIEKLLKDNKASIEVLT